MTNQNETDYTPEEMQSALFSQLVMMFASAAMHQMGKLVDPQTNKTEVNLEAAQVSIDMLDMLATRTHGNLTADEEQMLKETLSSLKMTFVETQANAPAAPTPPPIAEKQATPDITAPAAGETKDSQPRFHKKY